MAAGSGSRFGSDIPKQFIQLAGKPLIIHTLEKFEACPAVDEIILVLSEAGRSYFEGISEGRSITKLQKLVAGGETRAASVRNALNEADPVCEIVAVHDGARPLVLVEEIAGTIEKAKQLGAACLVGGLTDTIKEIDPVRGVLSRTIDRTTIRRALTPQAFRLHILQEAYREFDAQATDDCFLVERLGRDVAFVEGSSRNIKITREEDLVIAEAFLAAENL